MSQLVALKVLSTAHHCLFGTFSQLLQLRGMKGNDQVKPKSLQLSEQAKHIPSYK